jgi:formylglycine-generating enzyme required for sulfatase activity
MRGGNWNNNSNAGAFSANLNNTPGNTNNNIGFRCARDLVTLSSCSQSGRQNV